MADRLITLGVYGRIGRKAAAPHSLEGPKLQNKTRMETRMVEAQQVFIDLVLDDPTYRSLHQFTPQYLNPGVTQFLISEQRVNV